MDVGRSYQPQNGNRWSAALTVWTPMGGKRNRGNQPKRWRDEVQQYWGNVNWYMRVKTVYN